MVAPERMPTKDLNTAGRAIEERLKALREKSAAKSLFSGKKDDSVWLRKFFDAMVAACSDPKSHDGAPNFISSSIGMIEKQTRWMPPTRRMEISESDFRFLHSPIVHGRRHTVREEEYDPSKRFRAEVVRLAEMGVFVRLGRTPAGCFLEINESSVPCLMDYINDSSKPLPFGENAKKVILPFSQDGPRKPYSNIDSPKPGSRQK